MDDADGRTAPRERKEDRRREKIFDDVIRIISNALEISPTEIKSDIDFNSEFAFVSRIRQSSTNKSALYSPTILLL